MSSERAFHLYGDNIVECERTLQLIERALVTEQVRLTHMSGTPTNPAFHLALGNSDESLIFLFFPGFGRWSSDVLQLVRGGLREAPDIVIAEVTDGTTKPLMSIEYSGALAAGNQAWQRSGRAYSLGQGKVPYLYVAEVGGQELGTSRDRNAPRYPNPAVPFSYISYSTTSHSTVLPVFVPNPGLVAQGLAEFETVLGEAELEEFVRAIILAEDNDPFDEDLKRKALAFVVLISEASRGGRTLSSQEWRNAYEAVVFNDDKLVDYLLTQERIRWSKRISSGLNVSQRLRILLGRAAQHGRGLTSGSLPFCLLDSLSRKRFAKEVMNLYPNIGPSFIEWLSAERTLAVCWITGYKPRGDDSRPDRGLAPFARMLVGDDCDLLSVVYGPGNPEHWRRLVEEPETLSANGLWEAIMATSNAVLIDSTTDSVSSNGYLRSHWDTTVRSKAVSVKPADPRPVAFGEHDVDTVMHLILTRLGNSQTFEGLCNPPGGDWSGISLQDIERKTEFRWLSLPRVSGQDSKRPDHVIQLFNVANGLSLILVIESKDRASSLERNVGPCLKRYVEDLVDFPANVAKQTTADAKWHEPPNRFDQSGFTYVSAVAFLMRNADELARAATKSNSDLQIGLEFSDDGSCVVHIRPTTDMGKIVAEYMTTLPVATIGVSIHLHQ